MWIKNERTQEYYPVNEQKTKKVFLDGANGWCVLQDDGTKIYISDEQKKALEPELNNEHHPRNKGIDKEALMKFLEKGE